jgi:hypothetical protein
MVQLGRLPHINHDASEIEMSVYHHRRKARTPLIYPSRSASDADENAGYNGDEEDGELPCVNGTLQYGGERRP